MRSEKFVTVLRTVKVVRQYVNKAIRPVKVNSLLTIHGAIAPIRT